MKEKHQSSKIESGLDKFIKTLAVLVIGSFTLLTMGFICFVLVFLLVEMKNYAFIQANVPLIQAAVQTRCGISDYAPVASSDNFSFNSEPYTYRDRLPEFQNIVCTMDAQNQWQCTCAE